MPQRQPKPSGSPPPGSLARTAPCSAALRCGGSRASVLVIAIPFTCQPNASILNRIHRCTALLMPTPRRNDENRHHCCGWRVQGGEARNKHVALIELTGLVVYGVPVERLSGCCAGTFDHVPAFVPPHALVCTRTTAHDSERLRGRHRGKKEKARKLAQLRGP